MNYRKSWMLGTIPDAALKSEWARRNAAKRKTNAGGRPMTCGGCGKANCKACELRRKRQALRFDPDDPGAPAQLLP